MTSRRPLALALALLATLTLATLTLAPRLLAQTVVGTVLEKGTLQPLVGAFVQLEDSVGTRHGGVLSGPDGRFILRADRGGRYRLVAELIGYAGTRTDYLVVPAGETVRHRVEVPVQAVSLGGITAEVGERCRRRPGSGPATARLWEEARKALEVTRWAERQDILRFQVVEHERELDAVSLEVLDQEEKGRSGYWSHSPYQSIAAERLDRRGYVQESEDGTWDYYAPDADVLLSQSFLDAHCFRVVPPGHDDVGLIGLGFEPVPERTLPDLEGVLWLDEGSAELKRLDFTYTRLPFRTGDWRQVGGRVEFERLATGMWIVRRWHVRMPLEAVERRTDGAVSLDLVRLDQQGAEVRSVRTRDGTLLSEATGATLFGTILGPDGGPLAGATIEVPAAGRRTLTGEDGGYRLTGLAAGRWAVRATHPSLELIGAAGPERRVELRAGQASRLPLQVELPPERALEVCRAGGWSAAPDASAVLVYGRVTGPLGRAVAGDAIVRLGIEGRERRVALDSAGGYRVCLEPSERNVRLAAVPLGGVAGPLDALDPARVAIDRPGFVRADLELAELPVAGPGAVVAGGAGALVGEVIEEATERPVEGAMVELSDTAGAVLATQVTDARGRFRIPHPGAGTSYGLRVRHIGYATSEGAVAFPAGERIRLDVLVAPRALELDPIVVRERRRGFLVDVGFYERLETGRGLFVERSEIERRRPARITDLLVGRSGLRVVDLGFDGTDLRLVQQVSFKLGPDDCQPAVWMDGAKVRDGGPVRKVGGRVVRPLSGLVDPAQVEAMEVYTSSAGLPIQYGGSSAACGVILIWTRRPAGS